MAALWNLVKAEVQGTVDEFREKGVVGAFRDAALDTVDLAKSGVDFAKTGGSRLLDGARDLIGEDEDGGETILRAEGVPARGTTCPLEFPDGRVVEAKVVDIDGVSEPPRARVAVPGEPEPLLVEVRPPGWERPQAEGGGMAVSVIASIKQELNATVQDFREKGAVGALKDATLDAVDIVSSAASAAASGAKAVAAPLIDLDWTTSAADGAEPQAPASSSAAASAAEAAPRGAEPASAAQPSSAAFSPPSRASPAAAAAAAEGAAPPPPAAAAAGGGAASPSGSAASPEGPSVASGGAEGAPREGAPPPEAAPAAPAAQAAPAEAGSPGARSSGARSPEEKAALTPAPRAAPAAAQPGAERPKAKSIVSMRRNMFEKPKQEDSKPEAEELID